MTKKEFRRLRSIYLAMYDQTKDTFWFDKVKELTRKYEEEVENDVGNWIFRFCIHHVGFAI